MSRRAFVILAFLLVAASARAATTLPRGAAFDLRVAKIAGDLRSPEVKDYAAFCRDAGFNALWVEVPSEAVLDGPFVDLARWASEKGLRVLAAVSPVRSDAGPIVYDDPEPAARLREIAGRLRRDAGIKDVVLDLEGLAADLTDLRDITRFGRTAAVPHLELVRTLRRALGKGCRLWIAPAVSWDRASNAAEARYSLALAEGLLARTDGVGVVWSGPARIAPRIDAADVEAARRRFGSRALLLYDRYPANDDDADTATALVLGPLRGRDPALAAVVAGYVSCPMRRLGASRLPMLTVADFLAAPSAYDADKSLARAIERLAGTETAAREALRIQAMEWGGPVGDLNYQPAARSSPEAVGARALDPAFVASLEWTAARYPDRMAALERLADASFRDDVLRAMRRRLAVARLMPLVSEYRERLRAGRADAAEMLPKIAEERRRSGSDPDAGRVIGLFLEAAEVPDTP